VEDEMKSEIMDLLEKVDNIQDAPTRRPDEVPSVLKWKNYDYGVIPRRVVSEEINDFTLERLAMDVYWFFNKVGAKGIEQVVPVLRKLVEEVRAEAAVANRLHER
jgi:hypothetical protein